MIPMIDQEGFARTGREIRLTAPLDEATVRSLKVGDVVLVSGRMYTGRDAVHAHLMKHEPPVDLNGSVLYHCGPVVKKEGDGWKVTAAGPTTSIREEPYQAEILRRYGVRAVIGKGGMGAKTLQGLKDSGAVYLNAVGGAAQFYARCIERTDGVSLMEFGTPEAMWHLWVRDFPAIVTMDAHGNSLHKDLEAESGQETGSCSARRRARFDRVQIEQFRPPIAAIHRALIEIHGREVLNRQQRKWRRLSHVDHFRVAAALPAQLDTTLRLAHIRRGRHEILAGVSAIHAAVRLQGPPERAIRAAQHVRVVVRFDERRPGAAERAVAAVPLDEGRICRSATATTAFRPADR